MSGNPWNCSLCRKPGHRATTCPRAQCYTCQQYGHMADRCPAPLVLRNPNAPRGRFRDRDTSGVQHDGKERHAAAAAANGAFFADGRPPQHRQQRQQQRGAPTAVPADHGHYDREVARGRRLIYDQVLLVGARRDQAMLRANEHHAHGRIVERPDLSSLLASGALVPLGKSAPAAGGSGDRSARIGRHIAATYVLSAERRPPTGSRTMFVVPSAQAQWQHCGGANGSTFDARRRPASTACSSNSKADAGRL